MVGIQEGEILRGGRSRSLTVGVRLRGVGGPDDGDRVGGGLDDRKHPPPEIQEPGRLKAIGIPSTLHFGGEPEEDGPVEIMGITTQLNTQGFQVIIGDGIESGGIDRQEDGSIGLSLFDEILGSGATTTGSIVVLWKRDLLSDLEDGDVEAESLDERGGSIGIATVGICPHAKVDLIALVEGQLLTEDEAGLEG